MSHTALHPEEHAALTRMLRLAQNDTSAARCAADFLLAWWNASRCGGFDFAQMRELDVAQRHDVQILVGYIARALHGPEKLGFNSEMLRIESLWRSDSREP